MTPERFEKIKRTLHLRQPDLSVLTEQLHKPRNIAALLRTCDAVGVHELLLIEKHDGHDDYRDCPSAGARRKKQPPSHTLQWEEGAPLHDSVPFG